MVSSDECTLQRPKISEAISEEKEKQKFCKNMLLLSSFSASLFSFDNHHTLLQLSSVIVCRLLALLYQLFALYLTYFFCLQCQNPAPVSALSSLPLSFFIPRSSSPVIHPGQTTIPYKASGSPHLASYFHIRSFSKGQGLYRIKPGM